MKPLDGIKVLEFARVLAGPMACQILAELGAEVIKIERPGAGDESRGFAPFWEDGSSAYFTGFNRGKKSITLDLKSEAGASIARDLAAQADVIVENFLPGTMAKFGLGADDLKTSNPGLVYVSATGFGQTGPDANRPGYDTVFQALSGLTALTGPQGGPPCKAGLPMADLTSGLWIVIAVLTGLAGRAQKRHGTHVDLAMMDVQLSLLSIPAARYFATGENPPRTGTAHHGRVPSAAYECADGEWLQISASDQHWQGLCRALDLQGLSMDPVLDKNMARVEHRLEVEHAIGKAMAKLTRAEAVAALNVEHVPNGEVLTLPDALSRPQAQHREAVVGVPRGDRAPVMGLRTPARFNQWDDPSPLATPELGADTDQVLIERLGLSEDQVADLRKKGAI